MLGTVPPLYILPSVTSEIRGAICTTIGLCTQWQAVKTSTETTDHRKNEAGDVQSGTDPGGVDGVASHPP